MKQSYVQKHLKHDMYWKILIDHECTFANFVNYRSLSHQIDTVNVRKVCSSAYDDKRNVLDDGISTLAYGHISIPKVALRVSECYAVYINVIVIWLMIHVKSFTM